MSAIYRCRRCLILADPSRRTGAEFEHRYTYDGQFRTLFPNQMDVIFEDNCWSRLTKERVYETNE